MDGNQLKIDDANTITQNELQLKEQLTRLDNEDKKQDAQRRMAWVSVIFMVVYALLPLLPFIPESRLETLASISDILFLSQASIVGMFFGAQAYMSKK
jgi:hypothetical protein